MDGGFSVGPARVLRCDGLAARRVSGRQHRLLDLLFSLLDGQRPGCVLAQCPNEVLDGLVTADDGLPVGKVSVQEALTLVEQIQLFLSQPRCVVSRAADGEAELRVLINGLLERPLTVADDVSGLLGLTAKVVVRAGDLAGSLAHSVGLTGNRAV